MSQVSGLALGEAAIAAIAVVLAGYEGWLFHLRRRREHLWAAIGSVAMMVYAVAMLFHYDAEPHQAVHLSRIEAGAFIVIAHCAPLFVSSLSPRRFPIPTWALVLSLAFWMAMVPWLAPDEIVGQDMVLLDHPFPRHPQTTVYSIALANALALIGFSGYWAVRGGRWENRRQWRFLLVGMGLWALAATHDALIPMLDLPFAMNFFEYGFCAFALLLVSGDVLKYMTMLAASEHDFRELIDNSPDAVFISCDDEIVYVNAGASELVGVGGADLRGRSLASVVYHDDVDEMMEVLAMGDVRAVDARLVDADGKPVFCEVSTTHTHWEGRAAVVLLIRDVTSRRALLAQMMQADRLISVGTVAAAAGHEINNPLAYVILHLEAAQEDLHRQPTAAGNGGDALKRVERALGGTRRIADLVRAIGFFSRPHEGESVFDVGTVIESAAAIAANEVRHRATLVQEVEPGLFVRGNPSKLGQVFVNLLVNAAQALEEGAARDHRITVRARAEGDRVLCEVTDTGPGVPDELLERIFEPFFTTKPAGFGSGIGLGVARETVRALGGELTVDGGWGEGAAFRVVLPLTGEPRRRDSRAPSVHPPRPARLMLVDDEPELVRALTRALRRDAVVTAAHSAAEAMEALEAGATFDLVLSDLMMPNGSGMELYRRIAERWPDQAKRMVFMTGGAFSPEARAFRDEVPNEIIDKPLDLQRVRELLTEAVSRAEQTS